MQLPAEWLHSVSSEVTHCDSFAGETSKERIQVAQGASSSFFKGGTPLYSRRCFLQFSCIRGLEPEEALKALGVFPLSIWTGSALPEDLVAQYRIVAQCTAWPAGPKK